MKPDIHPKYVLANVSCACGNTFTTRSTRPVIKLDICSACHPLFTGKERLVDTAGRVEKFNKRFAATEGKMIEKKAKKALPKKTTTPKAKSKVLSTSPVKTAAKPVKAKKGEKKEKAAEKKS